jgi:flavin reductase (DIM6/NTAB) family NADH-FMN oxidoreductase RutF
VQIDPAVDNVVDVYQMLVGLVTPRPIAWVTTASQAGIINLAPFSFFNAFGANPPIVVFSPTNRRDGSKKDTLINLESNPEFVLNTTTAELAAKVNLSAKEIPPDESEIILTGVTLEPGVKVNVPRVREAPAHMECKVRQIIKTGDGPIAGNLVIGEVLLIHVRDEMLDANGRPDPRKLQTVARLGGDYWCRTTDLFEQKRP